MPIASGANGWPNSYFGRPQPSPDQSKAMVMKETIQESSPHPPKSPERSPPPPYHKQAPEPEPGCCGGGGAGAGAGCCGGASNRRYTKGPNGELIYNSPGTPCRRICACLLAVLFLLLLLGLILGLIFGLLPYLARQQAANNIVNVFPGGMFVNGIYYYPVPDPKDRFFFYNGPGIPCNPYNNNSDIQAAYDDYVNSILNPTTTAVTTAAPNTDTTVTAGTASTASMTSEAQTTITITPLVTVPNCADITTSFVETWNYTQTTPALLLVTSTQAAGVSHVISLFAIMASLLFAFVSSV